MNTKGQSATEFVILLGFMLVVFFIFFFVIQGKMLDVFSSQEKQLLSQASRVVETEIEIAQTTLADYQRTFELAQTGDKEYQIELKDSKELVVSYQDKMHVVFLPEDVGGYIISPTTSSENMIFKLDGYCIFPNGTIEYNSEYQGMFMNVNPEVCYIEDVLSDGDCDSDYAQNITYFNAAVCNDHFSDLCPA
ncbi:MAG: hypothetical protein ACOCQQ_01835 [Candidatus Nanoarchaeia archaeon]